MTTEHKQLPPFEADTLYRMAVEMARYWVIASSLEAGEIPQRRTMFVYPSGPPACMDWGNPPGDKANAPLRGKRVKVTLTVEDDSI